MFKFQSYRTNLTIGGLSVWVYIVKSETAMSYTITVHGYRAAGLPSYVIETDIERTAKHSDPIGHVLAQAQSLLLRHLAANNAAMPPF